jgi:Leucine-rich repeat (LRR) protein
MKQFLFFIVVCMSASVFSQETTIPDADFESFLEANGMGNGISGDHLVTAENIENVTTLDINGGNITDITGIEYFTALQELNCQSYWQFLIITYLRLLT